MLHTRKLAIRQATRVIGCSAFLIISAIAQTRTPEAIPLWPGGAPGAQGTEDVDKPTLTIFPAPAATAVPTGVVICPGGGYAHLAITYEGYDVALWLNHLGISAYVLKYRLGPKYHHPVELSDAQRAIRFVRAHADEYKIRPDRIGIWGFSAGGHLAATTGTHFDSGDPQAADPIDRQGSRPDFLILAYPVITLQAPFAHVGSRNNLLGNPADPALVSLLSNELQVTEKTPPTFLFHTTEDATVPVENSIMFYSALRKAHVPAEMHIYLKGRHGVGLAPYDPVLRTWPERLADWMKSQALW
jgi:acetyl esterase/lipase